MRPLDKGSVPTNADGSNKTVNDYDNWRLDLITRIEYICAYCNMPLSHQLQVEHVVPKKPKPGNPAGDPLAWENMLLACGPCNNSKDNHPVEEIYLPEVHNSHLPFEGDFQTIDKKQHGIIVPRNSGLNDPQKQKAKKSIECFGWDKIDNRAAVVDIRSLKRGEAREMVAVQKWSYDQNKGTDITKAAEVVATSARITGFFSLWYEVFADEPEAMKALTDNSIIKGTGNCFDPTLNYKPVPRNPGNTKDPF